MLDVLDIANDSRAKGSRGQMMKGCEARLRTLTFNRIQLGNHGRWESPSSQQ